MSVVSKALYLPCLLLAIVALTCAAVAWACVVTASWLMEWTL